MSKLLAADNLQLCATWCIEMKRRAFTLMEVLVSTAIAGLVITAGFRLIGMSYRLMSEIETERHEISKVEIRTNEKITVFIS